MRAAQRGWCPEGAVQQQQPPWQSCSADSSLNDLAQAQATALLFALYLRCVQQDLQQDLNKDRQENLTGTARLEQAEQGLEPAVVLVAPAAQKPCRLGCSALSLSARQCELLLAFLPL